MQHEKDLLSQLNVQICDAKNRGDRDWLANIIAPQFAFRRASGQLDSRESFLDSISEGGSRESRVESVDIYGDRAIAICIVASGGKNYHNLRMFVRYQEEWKLIGWANEIVNEQAS